MYYYFGQCYSEINLCFGVNCKLPFCYFLFGKKSCIGIFEKRLKGDLACRFWQKSLSEFHRTDDTLYCTHVYLTKPRKYWLANGCMWTTNVPPLVMIAVTKRKKSCEVSTPLSLIFQTQNCLWDFLMVFYGFILHSCAIVTKAILSVMFRCQDLCQKLCM
jgi:hypothetical protein